MMRVTCAIIRNEDNNILVVQRGEKSDHPYKWEFPGGKVNEGESDEESIIREIREELSMDVVIISKLEEANYDYGFKKICLIPFVCDTLDDLPLLEEHISFRWLSPAQLKEVDFSEADIEVADNFLKEYSNEAEYRDLRSAKDEPSSSDEEFRNMINSTMGAKEVEWIAASAADNPEIFGRLLRYSVSDDKKLAFHSSWALSKVVDDHPEVIYPWLNEIIESLGKLENESTQRSFLRIISMLDMTRVSQMQHGILADHCFRALRSGFSAVAIKAYSMEIIYRLAVIYPDLSHELSATIGMLQEEGSGGIISRGRMILKRLSSDSGSKAQTGKQRRKER